MNNYSAYQLLRPEVASIPLILDSPHSSDYCPADMNCSAPESALKTGWDAWVDQLWSGALASGASILAAGFHRCYIDANRSLQDIDSNLLNEAWPEKISPSIKTQAGMGLIRRLALPNVPMYDRRLSVAEVKNRIEHYYLPYHQCLKRLLDEAYEQFGAVWHIDCHSMKSVGNAMNEDAGKVRPDLVVSDREGGSANPAFTQWVATQWREMGYVVSINDPYRGAELVRAYSNPAQNRHSIQIEVKRDLYMDEARFEPNANFKQLQSHMTQFAKQLSEYIKSQLNP